MEVDVGDQGKGDPFDNVGEGACRLLVGTGDANDVRSRRCQSLDLPHARLHIVARRVRHRLNRDRRIASDEDRADRNTTRTTTNDGQSLVGCQPCFRRIEHRSRVSSLQLQRAFGALLTQQLDFQHDGQTLARQNAAFSNRRARAQMRGLQRHEARRAGNTKRIDDSSPNDKGQTRKITPLQDDSQLGGNAVTVSLQQRLGKQQLCLLALA